MSEVTEHRLARRIKGLRAARSMTLQQVSELAGFSPGMLSKIENALVSPSIATLAKLAEALDVPISEFFEGDQDAGTVFFPQSKRQTSPGRRSAMNYQYELLAPGRRRRDMQPMVVTLDGRTFKFALQDHRGEQFIYMLEGEMEYVVGDKTYSVREGDSLYFDARIPHGPKIPKNQKARYIVVFSEP
ncbi:MAG: cupin domain-containing protein [Acidobacteriota bacterium]